MAQPIIHLGQRRSSFFLHINHHRFHPPLPFAGPFLFQILAFLYLSFCLWMMVDCLKNSRLTYTARVGWLLFIFAAPLIGPLCYLLLGLRTTPGTAYRYRQSPSLPYAHFHRSQNADRAYQQVYQPASPIQQPELETQEKKGSLYNWQQYEEPQACYPEMSFEEIPPAQASHTINN